MAWIPFPSLFRKNKPEPAPGESEFYSHAEDIPRVTRGGRGGNQKGAADDPVLPEKKRARRRLVGAVALTLGLVIVLPIVLDSEPKHVTDDIVVRIPSREKQASASAQPSSPTASAAAEKTVEPPPPAPEQVVDAKVPPTVGVKPPSVNGAKHAAEPAAAKPKDAEQKLAVKPPAEPAKNAPAKTATAEGKLTIQVAALATQQKVDELQTRLKGAGIKSYTQKVATAGGERIRVRMGPFASKGEADQACAKLGKMSLNCTILPN